jgi:Ran GTPase-activating protein (RanGAP) involved in mRNA processing and transport
MSDNEEDDSIPDSDDDLHHDDFHYHFENFDSESDDDDSGCDCDECVARRGDGDDGNEDDDDSDDDVPFTPASSVPRLCAQLRTNDPSVLPKGPNQVFEPYVPESCRLEIAEALLHNTIVRRINLEPQDYGELSADAMAKYLAQSKHLLAVDLTHDLITSFGSPQQKILPTFFEAIGQSTSVQELSLIDFGLGSASESFENLLARTKTLRHLRVDLAKQEPLEEAETTAIIASGFSKNATLREIELVDWVETSRISVLIALRNHPVLEKLQVEGFSSLVAIDAFLRGKNSQLKKLIIERFKGSITGEQVVGFESFMQEMGLNTTILKMAITGVHLDRDSIQQLKAMLCRNTVLQHLDISEDDLGSAGFAEIASALYQNTFIKDLDVTDNGLDDLVAANALRELLRQNKTITTLNISSNTFGSNVAAVSCIAHGFSDNTTLQELDLSSCELDDQGISILAESLGQQKRSLLSLYLSVNEITCSGLRALVSNATAALSTVTHLNLSHNSVLDEGASFLAETLRLETLSSLKYLQLVDCDISDDGLVALMSALEENETLERLDMKENSFSAQGYLALASSLPNIKGLRRFNFSWTASNPSVVSAMLEGFRENSSLHEVNIEGFENGKWLQELSFLLYRNKFSRLFQDSNTDDRASLGLWSRALGSVAMRPDVLFHVLTSKASLIRATTD